MKIKIGERLVGEDEPVFIIAEAGINHNGDLDTAKKMIDAAANCGADSVKFQTFRANEFVSDEKATYEYETQGEKVKESMLEMFKRYEFNKEDWNELAEYCKEKGVIFFSTPQNLSDLELLLEVGVPAIKVGSDDLVNLPLLEAYSKKGLPVIISTGMAYAEEVREAVETIKKNNRELAVLHCVSSYPAELGDVNLRKMKTLEKEYPEIVVGFSDHSEGTTASIAAVALGAKIIEKHFTLDKGMRGPDHRFSADPAELKLLVDGVRGAENALGASEIGPTEKEDKLRKLCHRSIVAAKNIGRGEEITEGCLEMKRPGDGLSPKHISELIGKTAQKSLKKNQKITLEDVE